MALTFPLSLPTVRGTSEITLHRHNVVGASYSGTSLAGQTYRWGGNRWELSLVFPKMARAHGAQWDAVLTALEGPHGSFLWGPPRYTAPLGTVGGSPVCTSAADRAQTIAVSGGTGTLLRGSMVSIGSGLARRMYMVLADVSLAGGNMEIWPSLRGAIASSTAIVLNGPSCIFQLAPGSKHATKEDTAGRMMINPLTAWEDLR